MQTTIKNPIDGMIEICARRKKKIGGKDYLIYFETIAGQVKLRDGRSLQEQSDTVDEYFRIAQQYVADRAEAALISEEHANASELAAAASQRAALLSEQHAEQSKRQCQAAQEHCEQIAADVDAAIERAAYDQITERVVPAVTENATNEAVRQIVPAVTDNLWHEAEEHLAGIESDLFARYDAAVEEQDAAIKKCCEENKELIFDVRDDLTEKIEDTEKRLSDRLVDNALRTTHAIGRLETSVDRNTLLIDKTRETQKSESSRLDQRIDDTKDEINARISDEIESLALSHSDDVAKLAHTDMLQALQLERLNRKHDEQTKEIQRLDERISDEAEFLALAHTKDVAALSHTAEMQSVAIGALGKYVQDVVAEAILRFVREQAVQASINSKLQVLGAEFTRHQINDCERFSDLSLASVIHTRKLLEAKEERSEFVYRSAISDIKLAHTLMLQQVYAAQYYMDNRQRAFGLYGFRDTDNNVTGNRQFGFVPDDGSSATQGSNIDLTAP